MTFIRPILLINDAGISNGWDRIRNITGSVEIRIVPNMLIQCHTCHTKYRLNLERIPNKKTFVKCKHCGTPIYIDEQSDFEPEAAPVEMAESNTEVEAPGPRGATATEPAVAGQTEVVCDNCGAEYRVADEKLRQPRLVLKCSQCGNTFAPPSGAEAVAPMPAPDFYPQSDGGDAVGIDQAPPDMPLPDEGQLDTMFDDLGQKEVHSDAPEPNLFESESLHPGDPAVTGGVSDSEFDSATENDPDQAYMEATELYEDDESADAPVRGTVPDEQKYQIFMKPGESIKPEMDSSEEAPPEPTAEAPEIDSQIADAETSPADDELSDSAAVASPSTEMADAPEISTETTMPDDPMDSELPALPPDDVSFQRRVEEIGLDREPVRGQTDPPAESESKIIAMAAAAIVILAVGAGAWAWSLFSKQEDELAYTIKHGSEHSIALGENLRGRYVQNKNSSTRLFVVDGALVNNFPDEEQISWIRLKASALENRDDNEPAQEAYTYVGNVLSDKQLAQWELTAIRAYYGYNNGRDDINFHVANSKKIPFQIVFSDVDKPISRAVAEVVSYIRRGRPVFIQSLR